MRNLQGRRKGGVLVHCYAGQSRSVSLVLAYLCARHNMSLADAYELVVAARPSARPNAGLAPLSLCDLFSAVNFLLFSPCMDFKVLV